jgi:hypothetical protein
MKGETALDQTTPQRDMRQQNFEATDEQLFYKERDGSKALTNFRRSPVNDTKRDNPKLVAGEASHLSVCVHEVHGSLDRGRLWQLLLEFLCGGAHRPQKACCVACKNRRTCCATAGFVKDVTTWKRSLKLETSNGPG